MFGFESQGLGVKGFQSRGFRVAGVSNSTI